MPSQNGKVYGLTLLCPILDDPMAIPSHDLQIRGHLAELPTGADSPFAIAPGTHLARLVVLDDVIYVGMPAREDHLKSKYLVFESNCDGDRDSYLNGLAKEIPDELDKIWKHCTGYPPGGARDRAAFLAYMKKCEIETTFFFAPVNHFITTHQGMPPAQIQKDILALCDRLASMPDPKPAAVHVERAIVTGGRNE
jgi:hypothetical protein